MKKLRFKPSKWWYLPPAIAGGLFCGAKIILAGRFFWGLLIPSILLVLSIPIGVLAYVFAYVVANSAFKKKDAEAKKWARITTAWVIVIAMYVLDHFEGIVF